jgi:hypothetical protein
LARVHLLSAAPDDPARHPNAFLDLEQMRSSAEADRFGVHRVTEDPAAADLILFVETEGGGGDYFHLVRRHPVYRRFRDLSYVFAAEDTVVPLIPGIFTSIEQRWCWEAWARSGFYLGVRERGELRYVPEAIPTVLFSFVGAGSAHPVRERILALPPDDALLIDSRVENLTIAEYAGAVRDSAFVLCPRGGGTSTFRLFEAMMLGRVPVIVSDQWVPPEGPQWDRFSVRVPEADVESMPALLAERRDEATSMGAEARREWLEWFAPDAAFHRTVEWCLELADLAPKRRGIRRLTPYLQMLRPYHAARSMVKRLGHGRS